MTDTKLTRLNPEFSNPRLLDETVSLLKQGETIAFPTETVYGLGALASSPRGVGTIYEIKGRPKDKPLQVMVANPEMAESVATEIPPQARRLMQKFWPGPLTLIVPAKLTLSRIITAGGSTVALRCPDHPVPIQLIQAVNEPLAATSANLSGHPSPTTAEEVDAQLHGKIPLILDGGRCAIGRESTIVDCTQDGLKILRVGALTAQEIEEALR